MPPTGHPRAATTAATILQLIRSSAGEWFVSGGAGEWFVSGGAGEWFVSGGAGDRGGWDDQGDDLTTQSSNAPPSRSTHSHFGTDPPPAAMGRKAAGRQAMIRQRGGETGPA